MNCRYVLPFRSFVARVLLGLLACNGSLAVGGDVQSAISFYQESHLSQAKPLFESAQNDAASKNIALYYLGRIAFDEGDAEKSKDYLSQSVALEPNSSDEYYWLGYAYGELVKQASILKKASYASNSHKYLQLAVDVDPKNLKAYIGLFWFYMQAPSIVGGGIDKAEKTLTSIHAISPVDADILQLNLYVNNGEKDKQLTQAQFLVATYPKSAEALFNAADTLRNLSKFEPAITSFEAASKLPVTVDNRMIVEFSLFRFGETCQWGGVRVEDAILSVEKFLSLKADDKKYDKNVVYWTLAKLYYQKGDREKYYSLRRKLDPEFMKQKWMKVDMERFDNPKSS